MQPAVTSPRYSRSSIADQPFQGFARARLPGRAITKSNHESMQRKLKASSPLMTLAACAFLALCALAPVQAADKKNDPSGTWTWTVPGRNGGADRKNTLKLKVDGDKLTGTVSAPGRQGGEARETE